MFVGFTIVDTQDIIEKAHHGDLDYVNHALLLFTDFAAVFVRILTIVVSWAEVPWINHSFFASSVCVCVYSA